jgi:DNA invertase Pin-like site-specific DNA recombinase
MTFSIFGALGEYERSLIIERIRSGIARAKMQGRKFGRPRLYDDEVRARVIELRASGLTVREIARTVGVGSSSVWRMGWRDCAA